MGVQFASRVQSSRSELGNRDFWRRIYVSVRLHFCRLKLRVHTRTHRQERMRGDTRISTVIRKNVKGTGTKQHLSKNVITSKLIKCFVLRKQLKSEYYTSPELSNSVPGTFTQAQLIDMLLFSFDYIGLY